MSSTQQPVPGKSTRPLLKREPWLTVMFVSLIIMSVALFIPHEVRRYPIYLGLGVGAIGVFLLMIHKPDPAEEARWREGHRHDD